MLDRQEGCGFVVASCLRMLSFQHDHYVLVVYWMCVSGDLVYRCSLLMAVSVVLARHVSSHTCRYFNGVLHGSANIIHDITQSCTLVAHDSSSIFLSLPAKPM